jgi:predicted ABC-type transport system involved in lysophospholipase L1 biosynthesis ATPase subunit
LIAINDLEFQFPKSDFRLVVPALDVTQGERLAIVGPSGSGKTTLLHLIAGILRPAGGTIRVGDQMVSALGDARRRAFRATRVGLVFQSFELIGYLNVLENILLPYRLNAARPRILGAPPGWAPGSAREGARVADVRRRAAELAAETGLGHRLRYYPHRLSQGEKQRVAICRAMLPEPPLLLADEPTGNLDPTAKQQIVDLLFAQIGRTGGTLLMVTHDREIAARFPRVVDCREFAAGGTR